MPERKNMEFQAETELMTFPKRQKDHPFFLKGGN